MRLAVLVLPVVAAWLAIRGMTNVLYRPDRTWGTVAWVVQAAALATAVAVAVDRVASRMLPLATLLGMSLTFPDQTPSRFAIALRAGTIRNLQRHLDQAASSGLSQDVRQASHEAITLVTLLGRHERLTRGHTERVRAVADLIGTELGLDKPDRQRLAWASLLHDIGKLTVPPEILNKDGRPTDEEWEILKNHPAAGEDYVDPLAGWLGDWRLATSQHHERWDGTGYPYGLTGDQISLAGRIVAVADAYDVITSRRSYKAPMSPEAARREIVRCAGTQFDPTVVRALLHVSLPRRRRLAVPAWLSELPQVTHVGASLFAAPIVAATAFVPIVPASSERQDPPDELATVEQLPTSTALDDQHPTRTPSSTTTQPDQTTTSSTQADHTTSDEPVELPAATTTIPGPTEPPATDGEPGLTTTSSPLATAPTTVSWPSTALGPTTTTTTAEPTTTATQPTTTTTATTTTTTTTLPPVGPAAVNDFHITIVGLAQMIDVLANDLEGSTPFDHDSLRIIHQPHRGTATVADDQIRYVPPLIPLATSLTYEICDDNDLCDQATVTIAL
ncbi:MAG: HD-GYP domain-containing protein [Actinomycetota bacterium]